ncbi:N-acetylmuramoyl-L-alanine amidase family protein [Parapedobacter sp.]
MTKRFIAPFLFFLSFALLPALILANEQQDSIYRVRTIVLDAGHGGPIPGARGATSLEKDVALQVVLKLGKAIVKEMPDVRVLYTRTTDVNVELYKRIEFANENRADLFISVHLNSAPAPRGRQNKTVRGTETFVSLFGRLDEQEPSLREKAERENKDILLEENYEENYGGFDPNDPASYIILSLMKNQFREQSVHLATLMQQEYEKTGRENRGVQELSLAVLARASMPAVLTEIGFISNPNEETYMKSAKGQEEIVGNLVNAIKSYKKHIER